MSEVFPAEIFTVTKKSFCPPLAPPLGAGTRAPLAPAPPYGGQDCYTGCSVRLLQTGSEKNFCSLSVL